MSADQHQTYLFWQKCEDKSNNKDGHVIVYYFILHAGSYFLREKVWMKELLNIRDM